MPPTNRLLVIATLPPPRTGMTSVTEYVVSSAQQHGEVDVVNLSRGNAGGRRWWKLARSIRQLGAIVRSVVFGPPTPIYIALNSGPAIILDCLLVASARIRSRTTFVHHHSFSYLSKPMPIAHLFYAIGGKHTVDIALCGRMAQQLHALYGRDQILTVSNPMTQPQQAAPIPESNQGVVLGHLSNLSVEKGIASVIATFAECLRSGLDVKLHIAGRFSDSETRKIVEAAIARWPESVRYFGPVYDQAKVDFFNSIDCFLYPTAYKVEAQPLVLLEALASGAVILTVDRGCIADLDECTESEIVRLLQIDQFPQQAAQAISELADDPHRLRQLSMQAVAMSQHLSDRSRRDMDELMLAMLGAPPHGTQG